jgi:hypothetical protein
LTQTGEGETRSEDTFVYSKPKWLDSEKIQVPNYQHGAGAVSVEIISHNSGLDVDTVIEICEALANTNLVERDGDYFELSIDGQLWIERGGDPDILVGDTQEELQA